MVTEGESPAAVVAKEDLHPKLSPDSAVPASHTDREVNTSIVPEKPSEDGYNWRKYGQKNVKGNEYIRSYYKCSYPNCHVKKQVERSQDGRITDVTYLGNHDHDKPHTEPEVAVPFLLSAQVQTPACPPSAVEEEKPANVPAPATDDLQPMNVCETPASTAAEDTVPASVTPLSQPRDDHNENLTPKKRKKVDGADMTPEKPGHESRIVVQTVSEVDIVNDGYRWRKYGQKMVKGNPNPRSYYRCSTAGCPVKKHVERASYDPKVVITTYENHHDHGMPPVKTIVTQSAAPSSGGMDSNGLGKSKSEESDAAQITPIKCAADKAVTMDPAAKEKDVVRTENEKFSSDREVSNQTKQEGKTAVEVQAEIKADVKSEQKDKDEKLSGDQEVFNKTKKGDHSDLMASTTKPIIKCDEGFSRRLSKTYSDQMAKEEKTRLQVEAEIKPDVARSEQKDNLATVVTQDEKLPSDQETSKKTKNGDHSAVMVKEEQTGVEVQTEIMPEVVESEIKKAEDSKPEVAKGEQEMQDSPCTALVDVKAEVLSTGQKRVDEVLESPLAKSINC